MTVAVAFIDRYFKTEKEYFDRRELIERGIQRFLKPKLRTLDKVNVQLNGLRRSATGSTLQHEKLCRITRLFGPLRRDFSATTMATLPGSFHLFSHVFWDLQRWRNH